MAPQGKNPAVLRIQTRIENIESFPDCVKMEQVKKI